MSLYYDLKKGQNGDKDAIENIYLRFHSNIKKWSKRLNYEESETDLTIAFLELIKRIDIERFESNDNELEKFIYSSIKNKSIDLTRKKLAIKKEIYFMDYDVLYDEKASNFDSDILVATLINSLPVRQRTVIIEKFIHQHKDKYISQKLGISRQAVNKLKNRGLKNLRKKLEDSGEYSFGRQNNRDCV